MKTKIILTIENDVLLKAQKYASERNLSLSNLVEDYFKNLEKLKNTTSLVEFIDKLEVPEIDSEIDFKKDYHQNKFKNYVSG